MKIKVIDVFGTDRQVADAARTTIKLEDSDKEVKASYMRKLYLCEHSPIRIKQFLVSVEDIPYWIVMHFARHKFGIEHWVSTQRNDRTGEERGSQEALVNWKFLVNAQEVIFISRRRLCNQAHRDTKNAWMAILAEIAKIDQTLIDQCVPDCIYRGWCYEHKTCGQHLTKQFIRDLFRYREGINEWNSGQPISEMSIEDK